MLKRIAQSPRVQGSLLGPLVRSAASASDRVFTHSPEFLVRSQATARPHYAYCMWVAAELARRLGIERISAIEFGVAGGNGLAFMCDFAGRLRKETGVIVDCIGFDTGTGMPNPDGPKDLPYWFKAEQYAMDVDALKTRLPQAKLVLGNVRDTVRSFIEDHGPAPIGAIFNDTDYHSSTRDSLALFEAFGNHADSFLPRIPMYFDDVIGSEIEMYGKSNGQLAAIEEFNQSQENTRLQLNQNLLPHAHIRYRYQIYYAHLFSHPRYCDYIGGADQLVMESKLKLASG
ncbi:hypothetical protein BPTFM16_01876 [Altererythrobacter insulae]|nr:hypothetical protein BPTFM16_01876 [Altererythrobacter insulae]